MAHLDRDPGLGRAFQDISEAGKHTPEAEGTLPSDEDAEAVGLGGVKLQAEAVGLGLAPELAALAVEVEVQLLQEGWGEVGWCLLNRLQPP